MYVVQTIGDPAPPDGIQRSIELGWRLFAWGFVFGVGGGLLVGYSVRKARK